MSRSFLEITNEFTDYDDVIDHSKSMPLNLRDRLPIIQIIGICCSLFSYQVAYCTEISLQTPLMKKLGLSNIIISIITMSGPLCSCFIQPIIETASDNSKSKIGRRRPFIFFGGIGIIGSFISMYFIESIGHSRSWFFNLLISITILILNFSLQLLYIPSRSIITDLVPKGQQAIANLISSLIVSLGSIITCFSGFLIGSFSDIKNHFLLSITAIFVGIMITLFSGKEEPCLIPKENKIKNPFPDIFSALKSMPTAVNRICLVYFLCWCSFYPFILEFTDFFGANVYKGSTNFDNIEYQKGISFGMLTFSVLNMFLLIYKPFQEKITQKFGMGNVLVVSQIVEGFLFIFILFSSGKANKITYLFLMAPLGISSFIFMSISFKIVEKSVTQEMVGVYNNLMKMFGAAGQQISAFIFFAFIGSFTWNRALIIGMGFLTAFGSAVLCAFIVLPSAESTIMEPLAPSSDYYND